MDGHEQKILDKNKKSAHRKMAKQTEFLAELVDSSRRDGLVAQISRLKEFHSVYEGNIVIKSVRYIIDWPNIPILEEIIAIWVEFEKVQAEVLKAATQCMRPKNRDANALENMLNAMPAGYRDAVEKYLSRKH